jgi:hypothetical protein
MDFLRKQCRRLRISFVFQLFSFTHSLNQYLSPYTWSLGVAPLGRGSRPPPTKQNNKNNKNKNQQKKKKKKKNSQQPRRSEKRTKLSTFCRCQRVQQNVDTVNEDMRNF